MLKGLICSEEAQDYPADVVAPVAPQRPEPPRLEAKPVPADDKLGKARLAINSAKTIKQLDQIAKAINERHAEGVFTAANVDELLSLANGKAELLRGDAWEEQPHAEA